MKIAESQFDLNLSSAMLKTKVGGTENGENLISQTWHKKLVIRASRRDEILVELKQNCAISKIHKT